MVMSVLKEIWRGPKLERDKGFVWVILAMSFLSHGVHLGFTYGVLGNLTIAHKKLFGIDLQLSSMIGSVHGGVLFLFAPIASIMVKKVGCRVSEILGGTCLILGIGLSSLSTEPWHAFLLFGILSGIGISNVYVATSEVLALNFNKYKYLAFSLAVLGYYVGMVVFPIVSQTLLDEYGYSKAMGIMCCFHIIHIIAGVLFFTPGDVAGEGSESDRSSSRAESPIASETKLGHDNLALDAIQMPPDVPGKDEEAKQRDKNGSISDKKEEETKATTSLEGETEATTSLKMDFLSLLKTPQVWALLINALLWNFNVSSFLILINDFVLHQINLTESEAALGVTIIGIANIVGCILVILVSRLHFDRLILHFSCTTTFGICTIVVAFSTNKVMFYAVSAVWGLGQGASIGNLLGVLDDFCAVKQLAVLFGLHLFTEGIGGLVGAPICGYISGQVGSQYGIILSGCCGVVGSLCILPVIVQRVRNRRQPEDDISETFNTKL